MLLFCFRGWTGGGGDEVGGRGGGSAIGDLC